MSISSFNLSREARAAETRGTMIISIELCRISTTIDRPYARPIFGLRCTTVSDPKIRANNRLHSHSRDRRSRRTWRRVKERAASSDRRWSSGTKSHSHSVELDAINVIININNVIGHKKKPCSGNETIHTPLTLFSAPSLSSSTAWSCKHRRTNCTQSKFWLFWFGGASDAALPAPRLPIDKAQEQIPATTT